MSATFQRQNTEFALSRTTQTGFPSKWIHAGFHHSQFHVR